MLQAAPHLQRHGFGGLPQWFAEVRQTSSLTNLGKVCGTIFVLKFEFVVCRRILKSDCDWSQ
jgi:hypothetical protein